MIRVTPSPAADTRTCDYTQVTEPQLYAASLHHIGDVTRELEFFIAKLQDAARHHDTDKLTDIQGFHADFVTGFKETGWWDRHRMLNRHHLTAEDGVPLDVNLIDVLDYLTDCVMAGMSRSGSVTPLALPPGLLERAFQNTVALLIAQVTIEQEPPSHG